MKVKQYFVYMMASYTRVLYIGITHDLAKRVYQHKHDLIEGFTKKYKCHKLVYFEETNDVLSAISREKQLKKWRREKKEFLINQMNPSFKDLSLEWEIVK